MTPELISWLEQQHIWLQIAATRLMCNGTLTEADITELTSILKDPTLALDAPFPAPGAATAGAGGGEVRLVSLGPVEGIDALAPRSPLNFGPNNLVGVYGHNGSGKSGYTRIICKACGKTRAGDLKSNVFAEAPPRQACKIKYSVGGAESEVEWTPGTAIAALAPVDVFDTASGRIYLETETEAAFLPSDLSLLKDLVDTCGRISALLTREEQQLVTQLPAIESALANTSAGIVYRSLRHNTSEDDIAALTVWTAVDTQELESVNAALAIADPLVSAEKCRRIKRQREALLSGIEQAIAHLTGGGFETTKAKIEEAKRKRRVADEAAQALKHVSPLDGVGSDTWRALWIAAREFATDEAYPFKPFPAVDEGDRCVLCHQELTETARDRLKSFEGFVAGAIQADAAMAERELTIHLGSVPTRPPSNVLRTAAEAAELSGNLPERLERAWQSLETALEPLRRGTLPLENYVPEAELTLLLDSLRAQIVRAEAEADELSRSANPEARRTIEIRQKDLRARRWISEQAAAIRAEVARLKQINALQECRRQTDTRGISRKASELSQALVTDAYIARFNAELARLGANSIRVELALSRSDRGRPKHIVRLRGAIAPGARIAEILSEGERRIISLAAFLADVTGRPAQAPFIFDDPISSLDQTWEERTIDRLIALSADRQVIVFTHRLSLLGLLTDKADALTTIHIRREPWGTGEPGEIPLDAKKPERALSDLRGRRVARARNVLNDEGHEAYYPLGKGICSDLRILVERLVEFVLLADVVQRHRRAVHTDGKIHKLARIRSADCALIEAMMSKYSCFEHSQSNEAPVQLPSPDEISADIDQLLAWHAEFTQRAA